MYCIFYLVEEQSNNAKAEGSCVVGRRRALDARLTNLQNVTKAAVTQYS
jgi:hypothetical protein